MVRKVLMIVMIGCLAMGVAACGGGAASGEGEVKLTATDFKFDQSNLTFKSGAKVKITMANKGALEHTWILKDTSGKELSPKLQVNVGQTKSIEFTAPAAGTYDIVCDVAGHKEQGMAGKATVQ